MFVFWVTGCFENCWLDNDWDCVGSGTDSYYEFLNSSHAALDIRNGFSLITVLLPFIRYLEGKNEHKKSWIVFLAQQWGLASYFVFSDTRQFTKPREKLQSFCNVISGVGQVFCGLFHMGWTSSVCFCHHQISKSPLFSLKDTEFPSSISDTSEIGLFIICSKETEHWNQQYKYCFVRNHWKNLQ